MLTIMDNLHICMQNFARNLTALHKEISSEKMQGKNNFLVLNFVYLFLHLILII
jgi:hypothetical protein